MDSSFDVARSSLDVVESPFASVDSMDRETRSTR
jgi:hypothetical protein